MKPVPAVVSRSQRRHWRISASLVDVNARYMIDIGQMELSADVRPAHALRRRAAKKYGLASLSAKARVRW